MRLVRHFFCLEGRLTQRQFQAAGIPVIIPAKMKTRSQRLKGKSQTLGCPGDGKPESLSGQV
jgi:hypothetical protein